MKVALVGAGKIGSFHAETLRRARAVTELAVFDADPARRTVPTLEAALSGAAAAVIATPAATHPELVRVCVDRGLPVFCEKPLALEVADAIALVERIDRSGVAVALGFQRRFDAAFAAARGRILGGSLGRVHAFAMATLDRTPPPPAYVPTSGGLFKDMHVHDFDAVRWLFGQEVASVSALGSVRVDRSFGELGDVDTSALCLRLADGTLGSLTGARANAGGYIARLDVYGARAMASVREERPYADFLDRYPDAYRSELEHFLAVVAGDEEPAATALDGLEALRIAEAAGRSLREGRTVELAEIPGAELSR